jgi:phosphoribosylformylglycinamidine synthase
MKSYHVYVTAKQGIFDPAGATAQSALANLGYEGVERVKIGKFIELSTADDVDLATVTQMCEKLLANPIIEDFSIKEA